MYRERVMNKIVLLTVLLFFQFYIVMAQMANEKPRTIVTTDGEIDDVDSFIRMLLYANEFQLEGLIYSSSMWHYKGDGKGTLFTSEMEMTKTMYGEKTDLRWPGTEWMQDLLNAYEQVQPNLELHASGFPTADHLRSLIRVGNIDFEGEMEKDTEGSDYIKAKLLDDNLIPIYLQVWGGTNTIARALKSIEDEFENTPKWENIYAKVSKKAILFTIMDQDATYKNYISKNWPEVKVYYNASQFWSLAYGWKRVVPTALHPYLVGDFMGQHIINDHGPLTKMYYSYGDGQYQEGDDEHIHGNPTKLVNAQWGSFNKFDFISEGDSPAFLHLIDVGLDNLENPHFGGWGGCLAQSETSPNRWEDGEQVAEFNPYTQKMDAAYPQLRWLRALQQDFAVRADWCIKDYKNANHAPKVGLKHAKTLSAEKGETITLQADASDPDRDTLKYHWWYYKEVGTYGGPILIDQENSAEASLKVPDSAKKGDTIHVILEVIDDRELPLTRYQRVVIVVE